MGSNPILAAIYQGKRRTPALAVEPEPASSNRSSNIQTPRGLRLPSDDLIEVRADSGETLGHRVHVDLERQRAAILVTELRRDVGCRYAGGGQEAGGAVAERVDVDRLRQTVVVDELPRGAPR
jgi:hypothetical protein